MTTNEKFLTEEGYANLKSELELLIGTKRTEIADKIKEAKAFGDLSENSEYDEAKNEQANLEARILKLEEILKNAIIIEDENVKTDEVSVGSIVTLHDYEFDDIVEYTIVGATEADPFKGKISNESPLGKAVMGKKQNATVEVETPNGINKYKIKKIKKMKKVKKED